jgi:hypothetical protein
MDGAPSESSESRESSESATPRDMIRMPEMIPIPAGAHSKLCACGVTLWWVRHKGKPIPVSCPETLQTKTMGLLSIPSRRPTGTAAGVGINHYINCANRKSYGPATAPNGAAGAASVERAATDALGARPVPPSADDVATRIRTAEALAERYGVRCTGAPDVREDCGGFAVVAFLLAGKLFAAPCSAHADRVHNALKFDRRHEYEIHQLDEYVVDKGDDVAKRFAARCATIRDANTAHGFKVPARGPLT